jgi:hypothetical protein
MPRLFPRSLALALCASAALAACGGGGGADGSAPPAGGPTASSSTSGVPASALQSVNGLLAYMNDQIANMTSDTSEPVFLGDATLPASDTTEPAN